MAFKTQLFCIFQRKIRSIAIVSCGGFGLYTGFSIYKGNERFYDYWLMPLIHKLDPETSHKIALAVTKHKLLPKTSYRDPESLVIINTKISEFWYLIYNIIHFFFCFRKFKFGD